MPNEQFTVLQEMAEVLPRGSFHKLGLNASKLRTVFSSLSSSVTDLRTEGGSRSGLTLRTDRKVNKDQKVHLVLPVLELFTKTLLLTHYQLKDFLFQKKI